MRGRHPYAFARAGGRAVAAALRAAQAVTVGQTIEDETGWWQVTEVEADGVTLMDRHGAERFCRFANLGPLKDAA